MPDKQLEEDKLLMREIMHYLDLHPKAADTLNGIQKWWLKQLYAKDADVLERILDELVKQSKLTTTTSKTGKKIYKRAYED